MDKDRGNRAKELQSKATLEKLEIIMERIKEISEESDEYDMSFLCKVDSRVNELGGELRL